MSAEKRIVVVKGSGGAGLGDRICALAVGVLLAKTTGRGLFVDWRDRAFQSQDQNLFSELFEIDGVDVFEEISNELDVSPAVWNGRLNLPLDEVRAIDLADRGITWTGPAPDWDHDEALQRYSFDVSTDDTEHQAIVVWSGNSMKPLTERLQLAGRLPGDCTPIETLGKIVRQHIRFHAQIQKRIDTLHAESFTGRHVIGVHHRKTDEAAAVRSIPTDQQYLKATDQFLSHAPTDSIIFLATDNSAVQATYRNRYGDQQVCWTSKWMPESGDSIHKNTACPDGLQAARDALVDVGLLARCQRLVLTGNSSFSHLAGWFSATADHERKVVFSSLGGPFGWLLHKFRRALLATK